MRTFTSTALATTLALALAACASSPELDAARARDRLVAAQLTTFDDLDFRVFSQQQWQDLHKSHAQDVIVHWPDGHTTTGLDVHLADLKAMFVYAPDTRIETHPIKLGNGEWTAVTGVMKGTFSQPMPLPGGGSIPPTGKSFELTMATIGHWGPDGAMTEEYLFWDNATFMKQLGLAP